MAGEQDAGASSEVGRRSASVIGSVHLDLTNFTGPFDLLLALISQRRLDITEVSLAAVTDEFIAYLRREPNLSSTSEFLVVAATLLDMKARFLLPRETDEEDEDWEYLQARDLLFSRLLQYRAFKKVAAIFDGLWLASATSRPRAVSLEPQFQRLLPDLKWTITVEELAHFAAEALSRKPAEVTTVHLHDPLVPVKPQADRLREVLARLGSASFAELCADAREINMVVSRFLALLDLFREGVIVFQQECALAPLTVSWVGEDGQVAAASLDVVDAVG